MSRRYVAFDIEISKLLPEDTIAIKQFRPLGISCAAAYCSDWDAPRLWHSRTSDNQPVPTMVQEDVAAIVDELLELSDTGYTILTWNGLSFDFDILAEESDRKSDCTRLAMSHVDMMFHVFCAKGFRVGLQAAAQGFQLGGKLDGLSGAMVPQLWADGQYQRVLDYVMQDCRLTHQVAVSGDKLGKFIWRTKRGKLSHELLPQGWLTVRQALEIPQPDTSWMDGVPPKREEFYDWIE